MTDRELLEFAAKAAGIDGRWDPFRSNFRVFLDGGIFLGDEWNPLTDDGDALRLAVKLGLRVDVGWDKYTAVDWEARNDDEEAGEVQQNFEGDPYAATRRAIVRAAAAIGKEMP